ncbi:flagellar biosynthetic protein FliO [Colwellia sp. MT41]|uniref:flagellar biosynthetic protein FliO n=1 Tax=Colwellia sp. MT41 TaxID=58049 RepID=UPI000A6264C7|nr:flagellar biosynthetic protein FliO [Colwellia sp. MT41]
MSVSLGMNKDICSMIIKTIRIFLAISCYFLSLLALAESNTTENIPNEKIAVAQAIAQKFLADNDTGPEGVTRPIFLDDKTVNNSPEVGKHVMANMDSGRMILSLLMVLALIISCAFVLKRFNFSQQGISQLKLITSLSLGNKERLIVVQVGEQQLLLGVTAQKISLLDKLSEPLAQQSINTADLPKNILSFLLAKKS